MANPGTLLAAGEREIVTQEPAESSALLFERLARDPNISVEKIERLMALWERAEARKAEAAFNAAMSTAQKAMRPVDTDATNSQTNSRYASYEALDLALRPIYTEHGFGLSFDTGDSPFPEQVRVLCYCTHTGGYSRTYKLDMPADGKGPKGGDVMTKTHATGSAMSYGQRYLLKMIFNVAVGKEDDDGNRAGKKQDATAPAGYDKWLEGLEAIAVEGVQAFSKMWNDSKAEYRLYLSRTAPKLQNSIKAKAMQASQGKAS